MKRSMGWVGNLNGEYKSMYERELSLQTIHLVLLFLVRSQVMDATLSIIPLVTSHRNLGSYVEPSF